MPSRGYTKTVLVSLVVHKIMGIPECLGAEQNTGEKIKSDKPRAIMPLGKLLSGRRGNIASSYRAARAQFLSRNCSWASKKETRREP